MGTLFRVLLKNFPASAVLRLLQIFLRKAHLTLGPARRRPWSLLPHFHVPEPHFLTAGPHNGRPSLTASDVPEPHLLNFPPTALFLPPSLVLHVHIVQLHLLLVDNLVGHSTSPTAPTVFSRGLAALSERKKSQSHL